MVRWSLAVVFLLIAYCARKAPPPGKPDLDPPQVVIISPHPGDTVAGTVPIILQISDASEISFTSILVDGRQIMSDTCARDSFWLDTAPYAETLHTIVARATDFWDNSGESRPVEVFISRQAGP